MSEWVLLCRAGLSYECNRRYLLQELGLTTLFPSSPTPAYIPLEQEPREASDPVQDFLDGVGHVQKVDRMAIEEAGLTASRSTLADLVHRLQMPESLLQVHPPAMRFSTKDPARPVYLLCHLYLKNTEKGTRLCEPVEAVP